MNVPDGSRPALPQGGVPPNFPVPSPTTATGTQPGRPTNETMHYAYTLYTHDVHPLESDRVFEELTKGSACFVSAFPVPVDGRDTARMVAARGVHWINSHLEHPDMHLTKEQVEFLDLNGNGGDGDGTAYGLHSRFIDLLSRGSAAGTALARSCHGLLSDSLRATQLNQDDLLYSRDVDMAKTLPGYEYEDFIEEAHRHLLIGDVMAFSPAEKQIMMRVRLRSPGIESWAFQIPHTNGHVRIGIDVVDI